MERPWEPTKKLSNVGKKGFHSYAKLNTHDLLFATLSIGIRSIYIFAYVTSLFLLSFFHRI